MTERQQKSRSACAAGESAASMDDRLRKTQESSEQNTSSHCESRPETSRSRTTSDGEKKKGMTYLLAYAGRYRLAYVASVLLAVVGVAGAMVPYFAASNMVVAVIAGDRSLDTYVFWSMMALVGFLVKIAFHNLSTALSHKTTFRVISDLRYAVTEKLRKLPLGYVLNTPSGRLKNTIVEKTDSIETVLAHVVPEMTSNLLVPAAIIVYLFVIDWRMALVSLIVVPIGLLCYMGMMKDYEKKYGEYADANKHMNATAVEYVNGIEVIKAFGQSASSYRKFTDAVKGAAYSAINWMKSVQLYSDTALAIWPATLVSVLPIGCIFVMDGSLAVEDFVMIVILSLGIMQPLYMALSYTDDIAKIGTITDDIAVVLNESEQIRPDERVSMEGSAVEFCGVRFSYKDTEVIKGLDLVIDEGSFTALVGPSGSGKSTIAKLLAGYWDVDAGRITIGGIALGDMPAEQLMEHIAYVSQDIYLFDESVRDNIRMGNPSATDHDVAAIAKASGCHDFIMNLEQGYDTVVGSSGGHLSGGERQRIAIARAMLKDAPLIILDEATAYTDPENEAVIQQAVANLVDGKTLIVIAHRLSTIIDADQIGVIHEGILEDLGTHEELLARCDLYRTLYEAHVDARDAA